MYGYITAALFAEAADRAALKPTLKRHHLDFLLIPNETVIAL
jgi:hypothetical protein